MNRPSLKSRVRIMTLTVVLATPHAVFAQATSGSVIGTVLDPSGAVVPDASITVADTARGVSFKTSTNESGNYSQSQLTPGNYSVSAERPGFQKVTQENVTVSVGQSARVDLTMAVGTAGQEVTVTEAPPGVITDSAQLQTTLSARQIDQLPVLNRNFTNLTLLTPGATINTFQHAPSENPQQSTLVNTNGQEFAGSNYLLDGMNNNDAVLGIVMVNPPIGSVGEFTIVTSNYDAEYTQAGGAVVLVQTKSGSNEYHGNAFEFLQNNIFQGRDSFTQGLHAPGTPDPPHRGLPELRWNQFGGSLGGKIKKDKIFAFGDYQGTRRRIGASGSLRIPTAAERTGDLSDLGVPVYNPFTGNPDGSGRTLFPGARIPTGLISAPAANLLSRLPGPNITAANAADNNFVSSAVEVFDTNQFDLRADHFITENLRYFVRYDYLGANIVAPGPLGLYGGPAYSSLGFSGLSDARNQNVAADVSWIPTPRMVTDFRFGMSRYRVTVTAQDQTQQLANDVGIPGLNIAGNPDTWGLPDLNINGTGGFRAGFNCNCPLHERETVFDFINNWTKIVSNHTIKFGGTYETAWNQRLPSDNHRAGVYAFNPTVTSAAGVSSSGLGLASFLLGQPSQFQRFAQLSTTQEDRQNRMFFFVQDTWRATRKLTLSFGLRWDTWFPDFSLNSGQGGRYDVTNNIVYIPGVGGVSQNANQQTQWRNFAPRVGVVYAIDDKTVIRTGYGRSYFQGTFGWTFNTLAADVYPSIVNQSLNAPSTFQAVFPLTTAPPPVVFPTIPSNGMLPLADGIGVSYLPANQKLPSVDQWNLTVERQVAPNLNVSVAYVGNIGRHLNGGFGLNAAIPGPGDLNPRRPLFVKYGLTQGIFDKCDCTSSNYNSLQVQANKRFTQTYSLLASYTYSRSLDYGQFGTATNQYNARQDYGLSDFSRKHVLTVAHTLELPVGKGRRYLKNASRAAEAILGGWNFRGITTYNSGLPFSPVLSNNSSLNSDQSMRPDVTGNPQFGAQNRDHWFNPAAYTVPGLFLFGNAGRNSLRGPGVFGADWSLDKRFRITEKSSLEFRWEVFNALNWTNLANPSNATDSAAAGVIQDIALPMRNMQFGLQFTF
ncbi:MAG TPA: TonB-dependent receptor [Bryobacteraceae bacterium]|nr:TonB-dependent receptor [Bryobacteraceae bacterium]